MKSNILISVILLSALTVFSVQASVFNVKNFGAAGDGQQIDSEYINRAIDAAAEQGGGTVFFPAGKYLSYSIRLKSNITLHLDAGCTLVAAEPAENAGYDPAEPNEYSDFQDFGHSHWKNSLIWGIGLENISIVGTGTIDGSRGLTRSGRQTVGLGNKAIALKLCRNVIIKDISMLFCGHFALLATGVDNLTVNNVKIDTNRDGLDIDCCRNVRISDCTVNSPWDDAIVLKSSYALGFFRDTENVTITNCMVSGYDKGTMFDATYQRLDPQAPDGDFVTGRIKLGTESSGGFRNISISNCVFDRCRGLALETVDGGVLEDIVIDNITMRDIVNAPVFLRLGARLRSPQGTPVGSLRRVIVSNINVYNADSKYACLISGIPNHCIEDVVLSNIRIIFKGGYAAADGKIAPPENENKYPEPSMFGTIPASGFYIRHAKNVEMNNIQLTYATPDYRPSLVLDDVDGCFLQNYRVALPQGVEPIVSKNTKNLKITNCIFE